MRQKKDESKEVFHGFWIGLSDIEKEGDFRWRSNRTLSSDLDSYWGWDEPNNMGEEEEPENCIEVTSVAPYLNDIDCNATRPSICQKRMSNENQNHNRTIENDKYPLWVAITVLGAVVVLLIGTLLVLGYPFGLKVKTSLRGNAPKTSLRLWSFALFHFR